MTKTRDQESLVFIQLALNTSDMAATIRLYSEVFGFANGGGQCIWGKLIRLQGLDESARTAMWWMVGRQHFNQIELFQHTNPMQRPQPAGWRPSDIGWSRFGVSVPNLDEALTALAVWDVKLITPPVNTPRGRRAAFRDPFVGAVVEMFEECPSMPGGIREKHFDLKPAIIYATSSVSDIDAATHYYRNILKLEILPLDTLHAPEDEAIWGLAGAKRNGFVAKAGDSFVEVVQYLDPVGKPHPEGYRLCDQGIMNIALGSRNKQKVQDVIDRLDAESRGPKVIISAPDMLGTYINDPEREIEMFSCPPEFDAALGFTPGPDFFGAAKEGGSNFTVIIR